MRHLDRFFAALSLIVAVALPGEAATPCQSLPHTVVSFDSPAVAYAYAASRCDTKLVMRVDQPSLHFIVVAGPDPATGSIAQLPGIGGLFADQDGNVILASNSAAITLSNSAPGNIFMVGHVNTDTDYRIQGVRVVGEQQPAITNTDGSAADTAAKVNAILRTLRAHGLISEN